MLVAIYRIVALACKYAHLLLPIQRRFPIRRPLFERRGGVATMHRRLRGTAMMARGTSTERAPTQLTAFAVATRLTFVFDVNRVIALVPLFVCVLGCTSHPSNPAVSNREHVTSRWANTKYRDAWRYPIARSEQHRMLLQRERQLVRTLPRYASKTDASRFYPRGMYLDSNTQTVWVWSRAHTDQIGLRRRDGRWRAVDRRSGPLDTRRCLVLRGSDTTLCLGLLHERAFVHFGAAAFSSGLPTRSGFRDFAVMDAREQSHTRIYVLDNYRDRLWTLSMNGDVLGQMAVTPGAYRIGTAGEHRLFVLASTQPRLSLIPLDKTGMPGSPRGINTVATIRDAIFDNRHRVLWTAGYRQTTIRRHRGYIENLQSFLYAYHERDMIAGALRPVRSIDMSQDALCDPSALALDGSRVVALATGSNRVASWHIADVDVDATIARTGIAPQAALFVGDELLVAGFLDATVHVHARGDLQIKQIISLDDDDDNDDERDALDSEQASYRLGEMIFYGKTLWSDGARNQFTCQSCHWDRLTDYRVHPGFRESRWEQIRPAAGAGMLAPVFTPGQAPNLTIAVHGFFKSLDERFWTRPEHPAWFDDVSIEVAAGHIRTLSTFDARLALITYLGLSPVEPGMLRAPGHPLSRAAVRGASIFWRDCARCHQPAVRMDDRQPLDRDAGVRYLRDRPLVFAADRLEKTGVEPYFTERGNRISPLVQLSRGGPFFSNGSASTLADVIARTNPRAAHVHTPENATTPAYLERDVADLIAFLLSI